MELSNLKFITVTVVLVTLVVVIFSSVLISEKNKQTAIQIMVEKGANPLEAACALKGGI